MSAFRVGIAGPVGSGKTALLDAALLSYIYERALKRNNVPKPKKLYFVAVASRTAKI